MVEAAKAQAAQEREAALAEAARDRSLSEAELRGLLDQQREAASNASLEKAAMKAQVDAAEEARERNAELAEENRRLRAASHAARGEGPDDDYRDRRGGGGYDRGGSRSPPGRRRWGDERSSYDDGRGGGGGRSQRWGADQSDDRVGGRCGGRAPTSTAAPHRRGRSGWDSPTSSRSRDGSPAPSQEQTQLVNVTVPPMKMSGDVIQVEMEGQMFDVTVPRGVRAGQSFEVELPVAPPPKQPTTASRFASYQPAGSSAGARTTYGSARTTAGATTTTFGRGSTTTTTTAAAARGGGDTELVIGVDEAAIAEGALQAMRPRAICVRVEACGIEATLPQPLQTRPLPARARWAAAADEFEPEDPGARRERRVGLPLARD